MEDEDTEGATADVAVVVVEEFRLFSLSAGEEFNDVDLVDTSVLAALFWCSLGWSGLKPFRFNALFRIFVCICDQ